MIGKAAGRLYYFHLDADSFPAFSFNFSISNSSSDSSSILIDYIPPCNPFPTCNYVSTSNKTDLFSYQILGHIPYHKMQSIPSLSTKVSTKQAFLCQICPMARQQRLFFMKVSYTLQPLSS